MRNKTFIFTIVLLLFTALLFGCKAEKIQFYRESSANALMQKFSSKNKPTTTNSGIIMLHDENPSGNTINFGPRDVNFDLPIK